MIGILDYGAGNLRSVKKAFDHLGAEARFVAHADNLGGIERMLLPGVGAFGMAMEKLRGSGLDQAVLRWTAEDKPFLGICLGMQLLFDSSEETPGVEGLGVFSGTVPRFRDVPRVPQIGWNRTRLKAESALWDGLPDDGAFFYYLHGYYVQPEDQSLIVAETDYGIDYPTVLQRGNVCAAQFHPEKSADHGLRLLANWLELGVEG